MKKTTKQIFSFALCIAILFSSIPLFSLCNLTLKASASETIMKDGITYEISAEGKAEIIACDKNITGEITIPEKINGCTVNSIRYSSFENSAISGIKLPNTIVNIGNDAFAYCKSLINIFIPQSVISIGERAFSYCSALTSITLPNNITILSPYLFLSCTAITEIKIPDSVTNIGKSVFENCESLTKIIIPEGVTELPNFWLRGCTSLAEITIPDSVTFGLSASYFSDTAYYNNEKNWKNGVLYIGNHLIKAKYNLFGSYSIKKGTVTIADYAFEACSSITSVTIPDSVISIGSNAFYNCKAIKSVIIPEKVNRINSYTFSKCDSLEYITFMNPEINIISDPIPKTTTIYGYENSTAQAFAQTYNRQFVSLGKYSPHTHSYIEKNTKPATCKDTGIKTFTCTCGDTYTEKIEKLTTHTWGKWIVIKAATYESTGMEERSCSVCKKTESKTVKKLEYNIIVFSNTQEMKTFGKNNILSVNGKFVNDLMKNTNGNISVTDKDGKSVKATDTVKSGMIIKLMDSNGNVVDSATIVVPGDNNGDGKVSAADARAALRASVALEELNEWQTNASNVDAVKENKITAADARFILRASVGLESFKDWMQTIG